MPYEMRRTSRRTNGQKKSCYYVRNQVTYQKFAKCTTLSNAKKQLKLLRALHFNPNFKSKLRRTQKQKQRIITN
jgi:hypothetical protein